MIKPHPIKLPPTNLYTNDLKQIDTLLTDHCDKISYTLTDKKEDYFYNQLSEMIIDQSKKHFSSLIISSQSLDITLSVSKENCLISYSNGDSYMIRGIVDDLKRILENNTSWFQRWRFYKSRFIVSIIVLFSFFIHFVEPFITWENYFYHVTWITFTMGIWMHIIINQAIPFSVIYLTEKKDFQFIDKLLENPAGLIGPSIGAVIGFVLGYFIGSK